MTTTTRVPQSSAAAERATQPLAGPLFLAFDVGATTWRVATTIGLGQRPRLRTKRPRA